MKLQHLHINNFGHFADRDIPLSTDGLQVVYGSNEAGKTTLLEFVRGWLFDFPTRTPYDFKAGTEVAGVGTMILSDGRIVELRRRKGNKNKVSVKVDGRDTDLDDVGFQQLIGHANRNLFESVFAFGIDQLSRGEEILKHESLQSALFGGGLGSTNSPERIKLDLERQAGELFNPTARTKPSINVLLSELKELTTQVKAKSLRSDDYQKVRQAAIAADLRAAELHQQVDQLRGNHSRVERLSRAWAKWWELQQRSHERRQLSVPVTMPSGGRQRFESLVARLSDADQECERLEQEIVQAEQALTTIRLNPRTVSLRAEIKGCLELKQSAFDARHDLPERQRQRNATQQQIDRELIELRPGWSTVDLLAFSLDVATRAQIERLVDEDRARAITRTELRSKRQRLAENLAESQADLTLLGEARDVTPLAAALVDEPSYVSDKKQFEVRQNEVAKIDRQLSSRLRKLTPPLPVEVTAPHKLLVPRVETVTQFEVDLSSVRETLRATMRSLQEDEGEKSALQDKLAESSILGEVPSLEQRDEARRRRNAGWNLVRNRYVDGQPSPDEEKAWLVNEQGSVVEAYEGSIQQADDLADRIYADADAVARREESRRQLDTLTKRIGQRQSSVDNLKQQEADLNTRWLALWRPCDFEPLAPDAMRRWLDDHDAMCDTITNRDDLVQEIDQLRQRQANFEDRLRAACGSVDTDGAVLLTLSHQAVDEATEHQRKSKELHRTLKRLGPQLADCDSESVTINEQETAWKSEWQSVLTRLSLPPDWNPELVRTVIERLAATRVKLDNLPQEDARIAAMQSRIDEFDARIRPLCEALAPELLRDAPELAADKLSAQLDTAAESQRQHDQLQRQAATSREQLKLIDDRRVSLLADRAALYSGAEVKSEADFLEVVTREETIAQLDSAISNLSREIDLIRASDDRDEFERVLGQAEPGTLDGKCGDLAEELRSAEQTKREADGAAAVAKSELARLDGSDEAAMLTEARSRKRAQLACEVDRYVPMVFARHLLGEAVRRFERDNQPEMIASVSRLLKQMTAGRYTEFDRLGGDTKGILIRRADGVERTPAQLSTGTREQLYLAIRLAYVLHYCRQSEPLPIVIDDVLVNFDDQRAQETLSTLADVGRTVQVLLFTCHAHIVSLAKKVVPGLKPIDL